MELSKDQYNYGMGKVVKLSKELDLTFDQTILVIEKIQLIKQVWNWVNMGKFLMIKANEVQNFINSCQSEFENGYKDETCNHKQEEGDLEGMG